MFFINWAPSQDARNSSKTCWDVTLVRLARKELSMSFTQQLGSPRFLVEPRSARSTANFQRFMRQQSTRLVMRAFELSYYTYPSSIQSELFYTDLDKLSAQADERRALLPQPPAPKASVPVAYAFEFRVSQPVATGWGLFIRLGVEGERLMEFFMEKFIERQNITRFTTLLITETDTAKRELLQKLLTDEMVRQASHGDARNKS